MALRDWLNPNHDPLATENPVICAKINPKIATIASVATEIANSAILQTTDSKDELSRNSKNSKNSNSNSQELKNAGLKRLEVAARGLQIGMDELELIFINDLESFGAGEVSMEGIRKACEFYARGRMQPKQDEVPAGMVRCIDCLQDRCAYRLVTPYGNVVTQSSPAWRWCRDYTAQVHRLNDYRRR